MYKQLEDLCSLNPEERKEFIIESLRNCSLNPKVQGFKFKGRTYQNIYSRFQNGSSKEKIIFVAHHDISPGSEGALDNSAAVIEILSTLKTLVKKQKKMDLTALFLDGEEKGSIGAKYFIKNNTEKYDAVYNFEQTGLGDTILIAKTSSDFIHEKIRIVNHPLLNERIENICKTKKIPYYFFDSPHSDNVIFNINKIPSTVITIAHKKDAEYWAKTRNIPASIIENVQNDEIKNIEKSTLTLIKKFMLDLIDTYSR